MVGNIWVCMVLYNNNYTLYLCFLRLDLEVLEPECCKFCITSRDSLWKSLTAPDTLCCRSLSLTTYRHVNASPRTWVYADVDVITTQYYDIILCVVHANVGTCDPALCIVTWYCALWHDTVHISMNPTVLYMEMDEDQCRVLLYVALTISLWMASYTRYVWYHTYITWLLS